jgi:hypothetical protein
MHMWMRLKSRTAVDSYVFRWHFGERLFEHRNGI